SLDGTGEDCGRGSCRPSRVPVRDRYATLGPGCSPDRRYGTSTCPAQRSAAEARSGSGASFAALQQFELPLLDDGAGRVPGIRARQVLGDLQVFDRVLEPEALRGGVLQSFLGPLPDLIGGGVIAADDQVALGTGDGYDARDLERQGLLFRQLIGPLP